MKLEVRVANVTGDASSIGRAIATVFVAEGAVLTVFDIDPVRGRDTADMLGVDYQLADVSMSVHVNRYAALKL